MHTHIPGVTNVLADALSRLRAPPGARKTRPPSLTPVPRTPVPARTSAFWRACSPRPRQRRGQA
eukprot:7870585-Lingulodinium_polyedra.AAC.1